MGGVALISVGAEGRTALCSTQLGACVGGQSCFMLEAHEKNNNYM